MARCSTSRKKKGKWFWSSSGQPGTCPAPPRSPGSSRSGMPIRNAACGSWASTSTPTIRERPEAGNGPPQYPPVLARLQHYLAHPGERLGRSRLRQGLWNLGYPGQCPDRPRRLGGSESTCRAETSSRSSPGCWASERVTAGPVKAWDSQARGKLGGIGRGRKRVVERQQELVEVLRDPRRRMAANELQGGLTILEQPGSVPASRS